MKTLLQKLTGKILEKVENAVLSSICLHEIGILPLDMNSYLPMPYFGYWDAQYFAHVHQMKEFETAETQ